MLSNNICCSSVENLAGRELMMEEGRFFSIFFEKTTGAIKYYPYLKNKEFRKNTDDDMWVIPELIEHYSYKIKTVDCPKPPEPRGQNLCGLIGVGYRRLFPDVRCKYLKNVGDHLL